MPRTDQARDYISKKLNGENPEAPAGPPPSRERVMRDHIAAKLAGTDVPTQGAAADVPEGVDPDVWAKAQASARDPHSADFDLANAVLTLAAALKGAQA